MNRALGGAVLACLLAACAPAPPTPASEIHAGAPAAPEAPPTAAPDASVVATPALARESRTTPVTAYELPGDFAADTDLPALRQRFGPGQVRIGEVPGAEGEMFRGVVLFPDDSTRRAYLYFQDEKDLRGLSLIRVFEPDTRWRLADGITMGMPLAELVRRNGQPIDFMGMDWDYGGTVTDLHGGALARAAGSAVTTRWQLGVAEREGGYAADAYPVGDGTYSSDDPRFPELGRIVVVRELSVSFPGEDDL